MILSAIVGLVLAGPPEYEIPNVKVFSVRQAYPFDWYSATSETPTLHEDQNGLIVKFKDVGDLTTTDEGIYTAYIAVQNPGGIVAASANGLTGVQFTEPPGGSVWGIKKEVGHDGEAEVTGGTKVCIWVERYYNSVWTVYGAPTFLTLDIDSYSATDAAIDSRKGYGQPNFEGQLPGDPNADPRNLNFGGWFWRGGLFVGYMPASTGDQSGIARTQLWFTASGSPLASCLTLVDLGSPSVVSGSQSIGLFTAGAGSTTETNATWANRWSINPNGSPFSEVTFGSESVPRWVNWQNTTVTSGSATTLSVTNLCLAISNETSFVAGSTASWRYFGSREYAPLGLLSSPYGDCTPKLNIVTSGASHTWGPH